MMDLATAARETRAWACYDCGKCTATCPVARAGAVVSPRRQVLATVSGLRQQALESASLFSCLTCGLCSRRCPAEVEYTGLVLRLREVAAGEKIEPQCPHGGALQSLMRLMARGGSRQNRMGWLADDLRIERERGEVFYWTGCAMYFDALLPEMKASSTASLQAAVRLLNRLGVTPVVSPDERCCGHDLLWNGDREHYNLLAAHNVRLVKESGARTLVTSCAECLRTWKLDYPAFFDGKAPEILHLTEFLMKHLPELRRSNGAARKVTYQDPCRLGRHLGIYEPPRQVLAALAGVELAEMRRSGPGAACCAGGTWSNCDRFAKKIQVDRLREARATGAQVLVTACPKCKIHLLCAMKDPELGREIGIEMRDIAEVAAEALLGAGQLKADLTQTEEKP